MRDEATHKVVSFSFLSMKKAYNLHILLENV